MALGVTLATKMVPGIQCNDATTLLIVVVLLSFLNTVIKPLLVLFTLPFIVFTMVDGFYVASFGTALLGAIIVSVTNLILINFMRPKGPPPGGKGGGKRRTKGGGDVIDV